MTRRTDLIFFALILLIAAIVRVIHLDNSLWFDEIITVLDSVRLPAESLLSGSAYSFNNHVFYSLQAKVSILVFGESSWAVRLPALVFGIAGIAAMWRLVYIVSGAWQAHATALLMALSYHHVWFSQNARGYTELLFWCALATIVLIRCLNQPSRKGWMAYGLLIAAGAYTHLTALVFFFAQALYVAAVVFRRPASIDGSNVREKWLQPLSAYVLGGTLTLLLYAPLVVQVFEAVHFVATQPAGVMTEYLNPVWTALEILRSFGTLSPALALVAVVAAGLMTVGMVAIARREPVIPVTVVLHVILMLILLLSLSMRIWPRFFFVELGFFLYFLTEGVYRCSQGASRMLERFARWRISGKFIFATALVIMLLGSGVLLLRNYQYPKQDFEASIDFLHGIRQPADRVITLGLATKPYNDYYGIITRNVSTPGELAAAESDSGDTWVLMIFPQRTTRTYVELMGYLDENYSLVRIFRGTLGDGNILIYRNNQ